MDYYYIVEDISSSDKSDLNTGARIFTVPEESVFITPNRTLKLDDGEGPFESLSQLKEQSKLYQALLQQNPQRASKITQKPFLIPININDGGLYVADENDDFHREVYPLLYHALIGVFRKNDVSGVHFFDADRIKVVQLVGYDEITNVQQAYIEVYNANAQKWISKRDPTTFFPLNWSYRDLLRECQYAYRHRVKLSPTKYKGITQSGVLVVFIYDESQQLKTVYPICEEL